MQVNSIADYYNNTILTFNLIIDQNLKIIKQINQNNDIESFNETIKAHLSSSVNIAQKKKQYYITLLEYTSGFQIIDDLLEDLKDKQLYCYQLCRDKFFDTFYKVLKIDFLNEKEKVKHSVNYYTAKNNKPVTAKFIRKDLTYIKQLNVKDIDKFTLYNLILENPDIIKYAAKNCRAWRYLTPAEMDNIVEKHPIAENIINQLKQ